MTDPQNLHLEEKVQHDTDVLRRRLRRMADLVLTSLDDAVAAVANRVDVLERHIDRVCQEFLVRHMRSPDNSASSSP